MKKKKNGKRYKGIGAGQTHAQDFSISCPKSCLFSVLRINPAGSGPFRNFKTQS